MCGGWGDAMGVIVVDMSERGGEGRDSGGTQTGLCRTLKVRPESLAFVL